MTTVNTIDLQVSVPADLLVEALVKKILGNNPSIPNRDSNIPRIGQYWPGQGGIYAGVMRGANGEPDYHLIVGTAFDPCNWKNANAKAAAVDVDGHSDFTLPFRKEQALQFANVPELFEPEYYWSSEQHESGSAYARFQIFGSGGQSYGLKSNEGRARAVRRLKILQAPA